MKKEIFGIAALEKECLDKKCPFHGEINVKEELLQGKIVKKDVNRSATVEWFRPHYVPKYERYEIRRSRLRTHNPACINAGVGHEVLVAKTRPLSKTKNHVILKIVGGTEVTFAPMMLEKEGDKEGEKKAILSKKASKNVKIFEKNRKEAAEEDKSGENDQ